MELNTYKFFNSYGFAYKTKKSWGNYYNKRIEFIAKFLHKIGNKPFYIFIEK
jgi:hypothetical protein